VTELLAYIHTIILMRYNKKCSEKGALSWHVIQLSKGCFIMACDSIVN
jgi:hypothetical protein